MSSILEKTGLIRENYALSHTLWLMKVEVDEIGVRLQPGQFVHIQFPGMEGHILRRPFSVYYTENEGKVLAILYQVIGYGTSHMTTLPSGTAVSVMGPIGQGWSVPSQISSALLVAGGVGGAPLYLQAEALLAQNIEVDVILGAQTAQALVVEERYRDLLGKDIFIATDDGTKGHKGFCTDLVDECLSDRSYDCVYCCGPEPMMRIVSSKCLAAGVATYISLEKRMACGIGACLSCIVETKQGRKRSCVDGPVFDAAEVIW